MSFLKVCNMRFGVLLAVFLTVLSSFSYARSEGIAAVVNDGAISFSDLNSRLNLIIASSGLPNRADTREKLKPQVLKSLIEEELQFQEAERLGLDVTQEELRVEFEAVAKMNNLTGDQFEDRLRKSGANIVSFHRQLSARIAWAHVFAGSLVRQVRVTDSDVDAYIERQRAQIGKTEYLLSEIFLPVENLKEESKVKQLVRRVVVDLRSKKARFASVAQQLSKAPGASQGGTLGWVQGDQLDEDVLAVIQVMQPKTISDPIRSLVGYHVYYLSSARVISEDGIPSRDQIKKRIGVERSERVSRSHLNDLRSSAFIEIRE